MSDYEGYGGCPRIEYKLLAEIVGDKYSEDHVLKYEAHILLRDNDNDGKPLTVEEWLSCMAGDHNKECALQLTNLIKVRRRKNHSSFHWTRRSVAYRSLPTSTTLRRNVPSKDFDWRQKG